MVDKLSILFGFLSSVFIVLNTLFYCLRDFYYVSNHKIRVLINKLLPYLSKFNSIFIISLFAFFHIILIYNISNFSISLGYVVLFILLILIKLRFFSSRILSFNYKFNILYYLIFISLCFHIIFKI